MLELKLMKIKDIKEIINTILCGDSLELLKEIPDESVDLIFADPPYWMQTEGELIRTNGAKFNGVEDKWDKFDSYKEYDTFSEKWLIESKRVLKKDGAIWVIGSFQNIYRLGYIMQNLGFWILNDVIWSKPNAVPNFAGTRFQNSHESLLWCTENEKSKYTFNYKTMKYLNGDKQDKSVWDIGICIGAERLKDSEGKKIHSTQKPEKLLYKIILSSTKPDDIVLDPFFGTGTTGAIAKRLGRNYIGIEREEKYIETAKKRINAEKIEISDIHNLKLEEKPPKVSIKELIEKGYLEEGERLYNNKKNLIWNLTSDGHMTDGESVLSIHKMVAKFLGRENYNGWDYLYVIRNNNLKPINEFRYIYAGRSV
ncbi:MAG: site-specific DNA-methyltransferase [Clostridiales Family XIII bacterium]|jgi:site-specific DNA-methyltransferase (adenine-specific)|nr:site-specific DNA-methyltransferase [Clostridiales Family XIII bacterium]